MMEVASAARVNEVINHPSIHPWVCPDDRVLDFSEPIEAGLCIALMGDHGGFLFHKLSDGIYDAHSAVLPEGRGKWAIRAAREALQVMFGRDAREILMAAPKGNVAVHALIRILKAKFLGTIEDGWWRDGRPVPSDIYSLTKSDWEQCQQH